MEVFDRLSRETVYAILCALAAGLFSTFLIYFFFGGFIQWIFVPIVMFTVFISGYFAFAREITKMEMLTGRRIFQMSLEVGSVTHFSTFALYFLVNYFIYDYRGISLDLFGRWIGTTLAIGFISLFMFVWVAVPIYAGMGYILQSREKNKQIVQIDYDDSILDSFLETEEVDDLNNVLY
jgi:hypothetical protein